MFQPILIFDVSACTIKKIKNVKILIFFKICYLTYILSVNVPKLIFKLIKYMIF